MANGDKIISDKTMLLARVMSLEDAVKKLFAILEKHLVNQHLERNNLLKTLDDVKALRKQVNGSAR